MMTCSTPKNISLLNHEHITTYYYRAIPLDMSVALFKAHIMHVPTPITRACNHTRLFLINDERSPRCTQGKGDLKVPTIYTSSHEVI